MTPAEPLTDADLGIMGQAHVGTVRFVLSWQAVQATRDGPFDWGYVDTAFEQLALEGIEPLPVLNGLPDFAGPITDPETLAGWRSFAGAAVERYGAGGSFWTSFVQRHPGVAPVPVNVWEIWNEQNAPDFWPGGVPSPAEYAKLLGVSADVIRSADPQAEIMTGGMFGTPFRAGGIEAGEFLSRLYAIDGAERNFDLVALHPYANDVAGIERQYRSIRDSMTAANDGATDTWVTELGWSSVPDSRPYLRDYSRTPQGQADMLTTAARFLIDNRERWQIRGMVWYSWRDSDPNVFRCSFCQDSGLLERNLTPKPSLTAFAALTGGSVP
ncbi:MAG: hypothetical protein H0V25_09560 [Solirubrobacterales bacterium]|nr:hypothetical protein [Solirubrobacterales bacterium]